MHLSKITLILLEKKKKYLKTDKGWVNKLVNKNK